MSEVSDEHVGRDLKIAAPSAGRAHAGSLIIIDNILYEGIQSSAILSYAPPSSEIGPSCQNEIHFFEVMNQTSNLSKAMARKVSVLC